MSGFIIRTHFKNLKEKENVIEAVLIRKFSLFILVREQVISAI